MIKCLILKETQQFIFFILMLDFALLSVRVDTLLSNFKKLSPPKDSAFLTLKKESLQHNLLNSLTFSIKSLKISLLIVLLIISTIFHARFQKDIASTTLQTLNINQLVFFLLKLPDRFWKKLSSWLELSPLKRFELHNYIIKC